MLLNLEQKLYDFKAVKSFMKKLNEGLSFFLKKNKLTAMLGVGLLNGFLPCGFVYVALAGALTTDGPLNSALYMTLFGLGTMPLMMLTSVAGQKINHTWRQWFKKMTVAFLALLALYFVLRGLNLGIPFISPMIDANSVNGVVKCH